MAYTHCLSAKLILYHIARLIANVDLLVDSVIPISQSCVYSGSLGFGGCGPRGPSPDALTSPVFAYVHHFASLPATVDSRIGLQSSRF